MLKQASLAMLLPFRIRGVFKVYSSLCYGPHISSKNQNYDFHMEDDEPTWKPYFIIYGPGAGFMKIISDQ